MGYFENDTLDVNAVCKKKFNINLFELRKNVVSSLEHAQDQNNKYYKLVFTKNELIITDDDYVFRLLTEPDGSLGFENACELFLRFRTNPYDTTKCSSVKYDDLLYIEKDLVVKNSTLSFDITPKQPSNIKLAVTEAFFGVAAANKLVMNSQPKERKPDEKVIYRFVLNPNSSPTPILTVDEFEIKNNTFVSTLSIQKSKDVYSANLLSKNQNNAQSTKDSGINKLEYLKKLKELLDAGIITQEEFEAKKKQILGL